MNLYRGRSCGKYRTPGTDRCCFREVLLTLSSSPAICCASWIFSGQVALLMAYYNFGRPHSALRFGRTMRTPAMQAGMVKKRLSFRDVFTSQVASFYFS